MERFLLVLLVLSLLTACAPSPTPPPETITNNDTPGPGLPPIYAPRPGDDRLTKGAFFLDETEILVMESFPPQFSVILRGNLPTPCHELRVKYSEADSQKRIALEVYSVADPNSICSQMLQPVEQRIYLGSYPKGHYTVWVNGEQTAEFDAE